jgi:hypothetical protein
LFRKPWFPSRIRLGKAEERLKGCEALLEAYAQRVFDAHDENR